MCTPGVLADMDRECYTPVTDLPRGAQVLQGSHTVLYRRGMFRDDFMDLPRHLAREQMLLLLARLEEEAAPGYNGTRTPGADALLAAAHAALRSRALTAIPNDARWGRLAPPHDMFMVDDVYIGAYLHRAGVPRLVVPLRNATGLRVPLVAPTGRASEVLMPLDEPAVVSTAGGGESGGQASAGAADGASQQMRDVDSLHGVSTFNLVNQLSIGFFRVVGWW